jgi:ribosomal protein S21
MSRNYFKMTGGFFLVQVDTKFNDAGATNSASTIEGVLRTLRRLLQMEKVLQAVKEHRFYLKPSAKKKQKRKKALAQRRQSNSQRRQMSW